MSKLSAKLKEEIEALLPPTIFFFVALHLVALIRALILKGAGVAISTSVSVALASLILGVVGADKTRRIFFWPLS